MNSSQAPQHMGPILQNTNNENQIGDQRSQLAHFNSFGPNQLNPMIQPNQMNVLQRNINTESNNQFQRAINSNSEQPSSGNQLNNMTFSDIPMDAQPNNVSSTIVGSSNQSMPSGNLMVQQQSHLSPSQIFMLQHQQQNQHHQTNNLLQGIQNTQSNPGANNGPQLIQPMLNQTGLNGAGQFQQYHAAAFQ